MSDELIRGLARNEGVIQINFGSAFVIPEANEVLTDFRAKRSAFLAENGFQPDGPEAAAFTQDFLSRATIVYATIEQVADHFDHVISLVGPEHVGIGSDYDGVGPTLPVGLKDVSSYPNLVAEFLPRLEHELRIRLYDYISGLAAPRGHDQDSESD